MRSGRPQLLTSLPHPQNFNWEETAKSLPGLLERVDAPLSPVSKSHRSSIPSLSNTPPSFPQHSDPPQCYHCGPNSNLHSSDQCPGRPSKAFRSSLKVSISANSDRSPRLEAQADEVNKDRLRHAVTRADNLFRGRVALDGTKAVELHRLAAREAKLQHRYVTTKQHGVYEAIRVFPEAPHPKPRRQKRTGKLAYPFNVLQRRQPTTRVPQPAPPPVVRNTTWRRQHRADTPRPQGFGDPRRVHFAPSAKPHKGPVYQVQPAPRRLDNRAYQGQYQVAPYRPPQLFPKYPQHRQPHPQKRQQKPPRQLSWKSNNYYKPLSHG